MVFIDASGLLETHSTHKDGSEDDKVFGVTVKNDSRSRISVIIPLRLIRRATDPQLS